MSIQSEIDRINQAKTDLATAIESKGVTVPPNTTINVYPSLVQQIEQGAGLPTGGTPGQMLYQGESGAEWGDKPIFRVMLAINQNEGSGVTVTCDKTPLEIAEAYSNGYEIQGEYTLGPGVFYSGQLYLMEHTDSSAELILLVDMGNGTALAFGGEQAVGGSPSWQVETYSPSASNIRFSSTPSITATNVQDAIEEVNTKATRKAIPISIPTTGWTDNKQTFAVTGIPSDPTTYEVHLSQVGATNVSAAIACGLYIADEAANSLTLAVSSVPEAAFQVYAVVQGVSV